MNRKEEIYNNIQIGKGQESKQKIMKINWLSNIFDKDDDDGGCLHSIIPINKKEMDGDYYEIGTKKETYGKKEYSFLVMLMVVVVKSQRKKKRIHGKERNKI